MLDISEQDGAVHLTLNAPAKKNALTFDLLGDITAKAEEISARDDVRAVVLLGAEGCFSSGMDFNEFMKMAGQIEEIKAELREPARADGRTRFQAPTMALADIPVPVIAVIEQYCYGGALQLALGADIRIAHPDTKFSIRESNWGMIPDMGITHVMGRVMRADVAKRLIMTGEAFDGRAALDYGLVTELSDDPAKTAEALIDNIRLRSPEVIRASKRLVNEGWNGGTAGLASEGQLQAELLGTPNQIEAVMAGVQKRAPKFK